MFENHKTFSKCTSFHIAGYNNIYDIFYISKGDNGVGKSHLIKIFGEALFYNINSPGFLILSGTNFQGEEKEIVI